MEIWTAVINLGLATVIAVTFVLEARHRERRHVKERSDTDTWIRETLRQSLDKCTEALANSTAAQHSTASALETHATALAQFTTLIENGICPLTRAHQELTAARPPIA